MFSFGVNEIGQCLQEISKRDVKWKMIFIPLICQVLREVENIVHDDIEGTNDFLADLVIEIAMENLGLHLDR